MKQYKTKTLKNLLSLPKLYETDGQGKEAIAFIKIWLFGSSFEWYITEWDGKDTFFGLCKANGENELGYFSQDELFNAKSPLGFYARIDESFKPQKLKNLL